MYVKCIDLVFYKDNDTIKNRSYDVIRRIDLIELEQTSEWKLYSGDSSLEEVREKIKKLLNEVRKENMSNEIIAVAKYQINERIE